MGTPPLPALPPCKPHTLRESYAKRDPPAALLSADGAAAPAPGAVARGSDTLTGSGAGAWSNTESSICGRRSWQAVCQPKEAQQATHPCHVIAPSR